VLVRNGKYDQKKKEEEEEEGENTEWLALGCQIIHSSGSV
jgi:hypothetical protein